MTKRLSLIGIILLSLITKSVTACSCVGISTIEDAYKYSDFVGTVQVIRVVTESYSDTARIKERFSTSYAGDSLKRKLRLNLVTRILIKIDKVYKGQVTGDTVTIYTGLGGGDCGYYFKEGNKYIVYGSTESYFGVFTHTKASTGNGIYWTNICTRTNAYYEAEIIELEKLRKRTKNGS